MHSKPDTMAWHVYKLLVMFGIHKNINSTDKGGDDPHWVGERCMRECVVMKIRNVQCSTTEMAYAWLELWPGQFPIKGLQRVSTTRAKVEGHVPQLHP